MPVPGASTGQDVRVPALFVAGWRTVNRGKRYVLLAYCCNLALALPLGLMLMSAIGASLGRSLAGERMRSGFDSLWFNSFSAQATGVAATFRPTVVGIGAVLDALDSFLSGFDNLLANGTASGLVPVALVYLVLWSFLAGGFLGLYTAPQAGRRFLHEAGRWFPRMLVVTIIAAVFYVLVLGYFRPWLDTMVSVATRESIDERVRFTLTLAAYLLVWIIIWSANLVFDYTKVTIVRDEFGGVFWAPLRGLGRALRLVLSHPVKTAGLYLLTGVVWITLLLLYWVIVPAAGTASATAILGAFLLGQLFIFSRSFVRCLFYAGEAVTYAALGGGRVPPTARESQP